MNTINLIQEGFGTASCALLFVCICVFIVIYDASHSVAATHQLKFHDLGFTIMPGPKEGDEELKVGSEESEWPILEAITTSTSNVTPLLSLPPPPPPPSLVMSVDELAAAFQKLGITNVSAVKVFEVVREEQTHRRKAHIERGKILLHCESFVLYENLTPLIYLLQPLLSRVKHKSGGFLPTRRQLLREQCLPQRKNKNVTGGCASS